MFCTHCGMKIEGNVRFCTNCGMPLGEAQAPQTSASGPQSVYTPGPQPAPVQQGKPKKNGNKTLLWAILGAAAALLVAGVVILVLVLGGKTSKSRASYLVILTQDDGYYLNDEKTKICGKADDIYFSTDYSTAITRYDDKRYYEKNGERMRIGSSNTEIHSYDRQSCSWVLYKENNGEFYLFRAGEKEDILVWKEEDIRLYPSTIVSSNGKYLATYISDGQINQIKRVNLSTGEMVTICDGKSYVYVYGVDNDGCIYFSKYKTYSEYDIHIADGTDDIILEDIDGISLTKDLLLCYETDSDKGSYTYYTRPLGMNGELKLLDDRFFRDSQEYLYTLGINPSVHGNGYQGSWSTDASSLSRVIMQYKDDLYFVDLKAETYSIMLKNSSIYDIHDFYMTEDLKTAYIRVDKTIYKVTLGKEGWEKEVLTKYCSSIRSFRAAGLVFVEDDATVVVYDGHEATSYEGLAEYTYDFSDDLKDMVYANGRKIIYVRKNGEKTDCVSDDYRGSRVVFYKNYIYYINYESNLMKMKPGFDPEIVMENVLDFWHLSY